MARVSQAKLNKARAEMWERFGGLCQVCGRPVEMNDSWNYPHFWGRKGMSEDQVLTMFTVACRSLHIFQTDKAGNYAQDYCVQKYRERFGIGKRFWEPFMLENNLGEYGK